MKPNLLSIKVLLLFACTVLLWYCVSNFHLIKSSRTAYTNSPNSYEDFTLINVAGPPLVKMNANAKVKDKNSKTVENEIEIIVPESCGHFPTSGHLNITDKFWQVTNTTNGTFYLFNAYLDDREAVNDSVVRVLGYINIIRPTVKMYCQMWFFGLLEPISTEVHEYLVLWPEYWGQNMDGASPYLISCKNPHGRAGLIPSHVSLVEEQCAKANNVLTVINNRPEDGNKKLFLVCLRGMIFEDDISLLLIEWAEILKILGVDNVMVYVLKLHPNVMKVLDHYRKSGFFIVQFIAYPHEFPNEPSQSFLQWLQNELISYADAFYQNCYKYEFMIPMDIDEFVMPLRDEDQTWKDLIERTQAHSTDKNEIYDGYPVNCMYFVLKSVHENDTIEGIPKNLRFLPNIYRSTNYTAEGEGTKTFMRMDRVLAVHNHFPLSCIQHDTCNLLEVDIDDGFVSHYRIDCETPECVASKSNPVKDTRLWKYKDIILENVNRTVESIRGKL